MFISLKRGCSVAALCVVTYAMSGLRADELATNVLVENGKALLPIVISKNASEATKVVAAELASCLGRMSGTKFEIVGGDGTSGIVLGTLADFPNEALVKPLEIRNTFDGKEGFAIRSEPNRLLLIGATDLGVSHAAFRLLEYLGCRWFFPAREWEVIPNSKTLIVSLDIVDRPRILARRIWYGYGSFADKGHPNGGSTQGDYEAWARHNGMASSFRVFAGHAWQNVISANKKTFEEHTEYIALVKGERKGEQLCVSNPAVRELAVKWALDEIAKHPDREMVSMECSDGDGHCECAACAKLGTISDRVFGLANDVAKVVAVKHPGKLVGCLAYNQHSEPPHFQLEANVYVQLTVGFIRGNYSFEQLADLWPQKCRSMGFYEYFSVWLWDFDKLPGGKGANIPLIRESIKRYAKLGATSMDAESGNNWGLHGLGYYVANKLMWNPDADTDALVADFFEKAFGPAAQPMRDYYARWAPENQPLISRGRIGEMFQDVEKATQLAQDRPDILARFDHIKHCLRYLHLRWEFDREKDKAKQKELAIAILTHAYRTRYDYMNHWAAMRSTFASDLAKKFDEPTWKQNDKPEKPWIVETRITRGETEKQFNEGRDFFKPTPVQERSFSYNDLMPVHFADAKSAVLNQAYQGPERYAVASEKGEAIEIEITVGIIAWYRDRPDATWSLNDAAGNAVAKGWQKLDGEPHKLTMKVPLAGTYFFECNDSSAGWRIQVAAGRPAVWIAKRAARINSLGQLAELFFYVPRGTKTLHMFYSGTQCKILDSDRKVLHEITTNDEVISVDVPTGQDGKLWSITQRSAHQIWLFNAPNVYASSPSSMLLPRELVGKDAVP